MSLRTAPTTPVVAAAMAMIAAVAITATPGHAGAQQQNQTDQQAEEETLDFPSWQLQRFRTAPGSADYLTVFGTGIAPHLDWNAGTFFNYADHPMYVSGAQGMAYQTQLDITGTIGLYDVAEVGLVVPLTLLQRDELGPLWPQDDHLPRTALNDARLMSKFRLLDLADHPAGLSVVTAASLPIGNDQALTGDGGFGGEAIAVGEYVFYETIRTSANLGFRYRPGERRVQENVLGNEVIWGLGVHSPFLTDHLDAVGELAGAVAVQPRPEHLAGIVEGEVPMEARGALRYGFHDDWSLTGGLGAGLTEGVGTPNWRFFIGIDGRWATGGWWRVDYRNPHFEIDTDPCDGWTPDDQVRRLRFNPERDCPDPDPVEPTHPSVALDDPVEPTDWQPPDGQQMDELDDQEGEATIRQGAIVITEAVTFETGSAEIHRGSHDILDDVAALIRRNDNIRVVRIEGHTDNVGPAQMNLQLSEDRAKSVRDHLIGAGVEPGRLEAVGFGESRPVADNASAEGRAQNRRVEFHIVDME